jgi:hypothetical protein
MRITGKPLTCPSGRSYGLFIAMGKKYIFIRKVLMGERTCYRYTSFMTFVGNALALQGSILVRYEATETKAT